MFPKSKHIMVVRCYCCTKRFKGELDRCPRCNFENLKRISWIPEDLKVEHGKNHRTIITPPTISEMESYTRKAANDCKFEIESLVVTDQHREGVLEVILPEDNIHKFTINFNPENMARNTTDEIIAMLRHEIMHPITMQESSKVMMNSRDRPEIQEFQREIQYSYDEMINFKEYVKRFPCDKDLHSSHQRMFSNFSVIFHTMKYMAKKGDYSMNLALPYIQALNIYQDAVYNFFEEKDKLIEWAKENKAQALYKFWQWIHEDFNLIHENTSNRDEMREIIFLTYKMLPTISMDAICTLNEIQFNQIWATAYPHCQKTYPTTLGTQLLDLWKNRFDGSPYTFS